MPVISITRLRLRSLQYLPAFAWYTWQSKRQLTRSPGFVSGTLGSAPGLAFWTATAWSDEASMKSYRDTAWHKRAMPRLLTWCDEAAVARWTQDTATLPDRGQMLERMKAAGRTSKVRYPTPEHTAGQTVPDGRAPQPGLPIKPRAAALLVLTAALLAGAWQAPSAQRERPPVFGISHVAIQVSDLGKARAFYGDLLGLIEVPPKRPHTLVFAVNPRQRLIISDGLPPDRDERFLDLGFETDVDRMRPFLVSRGMKPGNTARTADAGGRQFEVRDPDGHAIQLVSVEGHVNVSAPTDRRISRRILHAGLTVKDAAAADAFYKDALGFSETWRGGRPEGTTSWINMRVPDGTDYLEYMLFPAAPPTRQQLGSAHHVALLVQDIQEALETVRARTKADDRNHRATPSIGVNRRWQLNVFDPDGTRIEFMEPWTVR